MPRTIVITGASDGIGAVTARELSKRGEQVVVVGRNEQRTATVARELGVEHFLADFARLEEVRELAAKLLSAHPSIDVLMNNAGGIMGDRSLTVDGHEKTLQVNHLAPFLLTELLHPSLTAGGAAVVNTSSIANRIFGNIDIDDLGNERTYSPQKAYGDAKLANILHVKELHRRYHHEGISAVAVHPGNVATSFAAETTHLMRFVYHTPLRKVALVSPDKGAVPLIRLAEGTPGSDWQSGQYYDKTKVGKTNDQAHDASLAAQLWDRSAAMVGL